MKKWVEWETDWRKQVSSVKRRCTNYSSNVILNVLEASNVRTVVTTWLVIASYKAVLATLRPRCFTWLQTVIRPSTNPALHDQESNSRPVDHKSGAIITTLPSHPVTCVRKRRTKQVITISSVSCTISLFYFVWRLWATDGIYHIISRPDDMIWYDMIWTIAWANWQRNCRWNCILCP